jgi:DNA-binding HxlR family transcriptional regulator
VIMPQAQRLLDKLAAMDPDKRAKFESLRQEMVDNLVTKRLDMLLESGVINMSQYQTLKNGGRKSIDEINRDVITERLYDDLTSGKITRDEYEE